MRHRARARSSHQRSTALRSTLLVDTIESRCAMYATCLFCHAHLGRNEAIAVFPVGRRLAFDADKGRLWVVCRACGRWNLTPLEERWEAVEQCERRFRDTRLRVSTENIGLTRLPDGLELIRIGAALRPEFAAWRYVDRFRRRRRDAAIGGAAVGAAVLALAGGGIALGVGAGIGFGVAEVTALLHERHRRQAIVCRAAQHNDVVIVREEHLPGFAWRPAGGHEPPLLSAGDSFRLAGSEAVRVLGRGLARLNRGGGSAREVAAAVRWLEEVGDPIHDPRAFQCYCLTGPFGFHDRLRWGTEAARLEEASRLSTSGPLPPTVLGAIHPLELLSRPQRLAMEIAANEEEERAAMRGELAALEEAWRDAEEIAKIADELLLPPFVGRFLEENREPAT